MTYQRMCKVCDLEFQTENSKKFCCSKVCGYKCVALSNKLLSEKRKSENAKIPCTPCEKCGAVPDKKYASGRFCSAICARGFSTSLNRKEISKKAKQTLIDGNRKTIRQLICQYCKMQFDVFGKSANPKYCSRSCAGKDINTRPEIRQLASERMIARNERGEFFQSFGRRVKYTENGFDIRCDSLIEWCFLEHFIKSHRELILSISRSSLCIPYEANEKRKIYIPDFDIVLKDGTRYVVECKSEQSGTSEIWIRYHNDAKLKKEILEKYCIDQRISFIWFTQKSRKDLYKKAQSLFESYRMR